MKCPNCGAKLKEDMLYCEVCGTEIQFVPDFEPIVEQSISETLSELSVDSTYGDGDYVDYVDNQDNLDNDAYDNQYASDYASEYAEEYDEEYSEEYSEEYAEDYSDDYDDDYSDEYANDYYDAALANEDESLDGYYYDEETDSYYYYDSATDTYYYDEEYEDYDDEDDDDEFLGDPFDDFEYESFMLKKFIKLIKHSKFKWVFVGAITLLIAFIIIIVVRTSNYLYKHNSPDYQTKQAINAADNGDYELAINYMERSLVLDSDNAANKYLLAEYYFSADQSDKAILMLWEIIKENDYNASDAYTKLIEYYTIAQDYKMIDEILANCSDLAITNQFQSYMAMEPEYSEAEGTYEEPVTVRLSSSCPGTIYYTTDGSMPTYESQVYTDPISLDELGIYTISSFFVNQYGIESDVVRKTYTIDIRIPKTPNVILAAGTYTIPHPIEVDVQRFTSVYYTTDGTAPNIFSTNTSLYEGPILMPLGHSHFIFVAYSQENICGDYTEIEYDLNLKTNGVELNVDDITSKLYVYNYLNGKCSDLQGAVAGSTTRLTYVVQNAIALGPKDEILFTHPTTNETDDDQAVVSDYVSEDDMDPKDIHVYYIFEEKVQDLFGTTTKTDNLFLVDVNTLTLYKASIDDNGNVVKGAEITADQYTAPPMPDAVPNPAGAPPAPFPPYGG